MRKLFNANGSGTTLATLFQKTAGSTGWLAEGARIVQCPKFGAGNWGFRVGIQHGGDGAESNQGSVHFVNLDNPGQDHFSWTSNLGTVGFGQEIQGGNWLLGIRRSLYVFDPQTQSGTDTGIAFSGNASAPEMVINDGHVFADADGTPIGLLVSTKSKDFGTKGGQQGRIYFYRFADKKTFPLYDGLVCVNTPVVRRKANGWFELFVVETRRGIIYRTGFNPYEAEAHLMVDPIEELRPWISFADRGWDGFPDGQWLSADGKYLVGTVFNPCSDADGLGFLPGWTVQHKGFRDTGTGIIRAIDVASGEVVHVWEVPGSCRVTCSAPVMTSSGWKLLITTADEGMSPCQHALNSERGNLFIAELPQGLEPSKPVLIPADFAV